jgi:GTP-binding protein
MNKTIRNIAIIAHVDHGKTTLLDGLLKQSHLFRDNQSEMSQHLIMDSGDQEKERGITITAKITAVEWQDTRINIIDTPGHADFSGEVERTLSMADGVLLIVDAQEGPMPQTKFVLEKALELELKPIVIINKIDKTARRIAEVEDELADLFLELAVHEDQLHYPVYYAIGREAKAWKTIPEDSSAPGDLTTIFEAIMEHVPVPRVEPDQPFQMLVSALRYDSFLGKYAVGRVQRGNIKQGQRVAICKKDGKIIYGKAEKIFMSHGLEQKEFDSATAGDIISITGLSDVMIGETLADSEKPEALPVLEVEAPTIKVYLGPNTSPFKGKESKFNTSRQIGDRLQKELETNVSLRVEDSGIGFLVAGRGELHLGVLMETMRREGYEFEVGKPIVVTHIENGIEVEPIEEVIIEVPPEHLGAVQMEFGRRKGELIEQFSSSKGVSKLIYMIPTRNLLGARNILITATKGTVIMNSLIKSFGQVSGRLDQLRSGVIIAFETGTTTAYSLQSAEQRGVCFVGPGESVYAGQIVGQNARGEDLEVNVVKEKHLTNMRSSSSDGVVQLTPPIRYTLEQSLDFLENDELLEITPKSLRLRKVELDHSARKRGAKK